ncbi:MAG: BamA/TamA family outer membrane protein [Cyanobacteria bacterium SBC]|nr:BamA/TamA family outer membrane protein [Cyanobacteria bacterium SBC]
MKPTSDSIARLTVSPIVGLFPLFVNAPTLATISSQPIEATSSKRSTSTFVKASVSNRKARQSQHEIESLPLSPSLTSQPLGESIDLAFRESSTFAPSETIRFEFLPGDELDRQFDRSIAEVEVPCGFLNAERSETQGEEQLEDEIGEDETTEEGSEFVPCVCELANPSCCFQSTGFIITELQPEPARIDPSRGPIVFQRPRILTTDEFVGLEPGFAFLPVGGDIDRARGLNLKVQFNWRTPRRDTVAFTIAGGERLAAINLSYTQPAVLGEIDRIGYRVSFFIKHSPENAYLSDEDNGTDAREVFLPIGDEQVPWVNRIGGAAQFFVPLSENTVLLPGLSYERVRIQNRAFTDNLFDRDEEGNRLSFSDDGEDDLLLLSLMLRGTNATLNEDGFPISGDIYRIGTEQSIPIGLSNMDFNRLSGFYRRYFPIDGLGSGDDTDVLVLDIQAGTIIGEVPGYEAFELGGRASVRGFVTGDVGTAQSFFQVRTEYRFPILRWEDGWLFDKLRGFVFLQYATDLGTGGQVRGEPAEVRDKPGDALGFGFGLNLIGVPVAGVLNVDFGFTNEGTFNFTATVGPRF